MTPESEQTFLSLVRQGIGKGDSIPDVVDWQAIKALADKQGLAAIIVDGIEQLPDTKRPPKELLLQWIGEVIQNYENYYGLYQKAIAELAGWYNAHGYKMMVLKGYACSINWPKPGHRPCGDIDIWLFGQYKEADAALIQWFKSSKVHGFEIDNSHHHHTTFLWRNFLVENHYDFINIHHHKSNIELDRIFKELSSDDSYSVEVNGVKVYMPSPKFHAFFLMRHTMNHFSSSEITFRQLLDWAFFVEKHGKDIDWEWLENILERFGMKKLYEVFNAICVDDLGFSSTIFPIVQYEPLLKKRVLKEIIEPGFSEIEPKGVLRRVFFKYRRWKANGWKHKLCYKEGMWSAFWSGVWSHFLKPSSI